jgi:hypothetical protein
MNQLRHRHVVKDKAKTAAFNRKADRALTRAIARMPTAKPAPKDNCEFCLGAKGGVRGNENRVPAKRLRKRWVVVCDYCSVLLMYIDRARVMTPRIR